MGVEWALADHKNRRLFELGKGPWPETLRPLPWTLGDMAARVADGWIEWCWAIDSAAEKLAELRYAVTVACNLWAFIGEARRDVELLNDSDGSLGDATERGYVITRSRYTPGGGS